MNIRDIEYFVALAEEGSFNRAAIHCNTTQPTISNSIQRMERELGASLFKRTTRSLALTKKGAEILEYAHNILISVNIIKDIAKSVGNTSKVINLGLSASLAYYFYDKISFYLPSVVNEQLNVHEVNKNNLKSQLNSGVMNCILLACDEEIIDFDKILVGEYSYVLAVHSDDDFLNRDSVSLSELRSRKILLTQDNNPYDSSLKKLLLNCNSDYAQDLIFNSIEIVKMAIRSKKGIGIMPEYAMKQHESISYIPFSDVEIKRKIYIVFRKNDPNREIYKKISTTIFSVLEHIIT
ncbi:LysR family transcriptional regulator [Pantoea sp. Fr+CA_20]|uniref:LysR family transcriptional regulator n=1 Tax=Pantoea sp. Fr+CA_20 TaxID=2929506 RepID=UPI0021194714|nr:LysR family transcriptional regulator [Pantoea sp. Fr+CA_20]